MPRGSPSSLVCMATLEMSSSSNTFCVCVREDRRVRQGREIDREERERQGQGEIEIDRERKELTERKERKSGVRKQTTQVDKSRDCEEGMKRSSDNPVKYRGAQGCRWVGVGP